MKKNILQRIEQERIEREKPKLKLLNKKFNNELKQQEALYQKDSNHNQNLKSQRHLEELYQKGF